MSIKITDKKRRVKAVHGVEKIQKDPDFELQLSNHLKTSYSQEGLLELYSRFTLGYGAMDSLLRKALWRSLTRKFGHGVYIGAGVGFKHIETFEIGSGIFIGDQSYLQGRFEGTCIIKNHVWIGPQSYFDARDLIIEEYVGWGPGAKVLGSNHTGIPINLPVVQTDLEIKPVRIEREADIGMNAVILPGVTVGKASIVGAGAVVTTDVPAYAVVAGVPAKFLHWRKGYEAPENRKALSPHSQKGKDSSED